jgi:hypothetical protein
MTYARVDDDGNAVREADGSLEMRPAQPMEYANGVCYGWLYSMMQIEYEHLYSMVQSIQKARLVLGGHEVLPTSHLRLMAADSATLQRAT